MFARYAVMTGLAAAMCLAASANAQLPPPLEAALSGSPDQRDPARMTLRWTVEGQSLTFEMQLAEDGERVYELIEPDEAALSESQREIWASVTRERRDDAEPQTGSQGRASVNVGSVDFSALRDTVGGSATLDRTGPDGTLVYSFAPRAMPGGNESPEAMLRALRGEVTVDPERGELTGFRLFSADSFKPSIAARIERFLLRQDFVHDPVLGGPRFSAMEMDIAGSAAFRRFEQSLQIELLSVDWREAAGAAETLGPAADSP